mgnify:CR=1 FL=1
MKTTNAWFITGTDTEIGKTFLACALLHAFRSRGLRALAMKPIAAGVDADGLNEDVERLLAASSWQAPRALVNPYCFQPAIAPHIAAAEAGVEIELPPIVDAFRQLQAMADVILVEGVGGFRVPLGSRHDTVDLASLLDLPIILVVGMRLGCINHALLTAQAIAARGLTLAGWVANRIDPTLSRFDENLATLETHLPAPLLGVIAHGTTPSQAGPLLRLPG